MKTKFRTQALALFMAGAMMVATTGCSKAPSVGGATSGGATTMNASTVKVVLQGVLTAAGVALGLLAPGATAEVSKFTADGQQIISQWNVGLSWKQNVLASIPLVITDASNLIPKCADSAKCQLVVNDLVAGLNTVEADLKGLGAQMKLKIRGVKTYDTFEAFRSDWNRDAPPEAQLATVEIIVMTAQRRAA